MVELIARPNEILIEIGIVREQIADGHTVPVLDEILPIDDPGRFGRHRHIAEPCWTASDNKGAAVTVERQPPGSQLVEEVAED